MAIVPKKFSDEFKRAAVAMVASGMSQELVCRGPGFLEDRAADMGAR